jgi:hypothetical protein
MRSVWCLSRLFQYLNNSMTFIKYSVKVATLEADVLTSNTSSNTTIDYARNCEVEATVQALNPLKYSGKYMSHLFYNQ